MFKKLFQEDIDMDTMELAEGMVEDAIDKQMKTIDKKMRNMEVKIMETIQQSIPELVEAAVNEAVEKKFSVDLEERMDASISSALLDTLGLKRLMLRKKIEDLDKDFYYKKGKGLLSEKDESVFKKEIKKMEDSISFINKILAIFDEV